jgi:predicted metal-dependent hydrolase
VSPSTPETRRILLGAITVDYTLQRSARRTRLGLIVRPGTGLQVQAPLRISLSEIESVLRRKSDWVLRHLQASQIRAEQSAAQRIDWTDGAQLPWLGQPLRLEVLNVPGRQPVWMPAVGQTPARLLIGRLASSAQTDPETAHAALRARVERWWREEALAWFQQRCDHFAPPMGVRPERIALSSATTRWGSATRRKTGGPGSIRLSWRLMFFRPELIDYVIVHELAHLHEMNHGPAFWAWVESVLPDWRQRQAELRQQPVPDWG